MTKRFLIKKSDLIVLISLFIASFVSIAAGCIFFLFFISMSRKITDMAFIFPIFVIAVVAFTQYSTDLKGNYDVIRYYRSYLTLSECNISQAISIIGISGDYLFYIIVFLISKIFPNEPRFFAFFFSLVTGILMFMSYKDIMTYCKDKNLILPNNLNGLFLWIIGFICIISIVNYTNAVRQFFAFSIFLYAVSRSFLHKKFFILLLMSVLSHWSMAILAIIFLIVRNNINILYIGLLPTLFVGLLNPASIIAKITDKTEFYLSGIERLGTDKTMMVVLFVSSLIFAYIVHRIAPKDRKLAIVPCIILLCDMLFIRQSTIATRFYFNLTQCLTIFLPVIISSNKLMKRNIETSLFFIMISLIIFYNIKQILLADFSYLIFSKYSIFDSAISIFLTPFPGNML